MAKGPRISRALGWYLGRLGLQTGILLLLAASCFYGLISIPQHEADSSRAWPIQRAIGNPCGNIHNGLLRGFHDNLESFSELLRGTCTTQDLADALYLAGNYPTAIELYETFLRQDGQNSPQKGRVHDALLRLSACLDHVGMSESAFSYARRAMAVDGRADPIYSLARYHERRNEDNMAAYYYTLACQAPLIDPGVLHTLAGIDKQHLWPRLFPKAYLDELAASQVLADDPAISDETHAQMHWETINRARPLLATGREVFRREGIFQNAGEFYHATPSIVLHPNDSHDHLILVRLLNYRIDHEGRYYRDYLPTDDTSGALRSSSALYLGQAAEEGHVITIDDAGYQRTPYKFMGTEDPRIFRMDNGDVRVLWISWEYAKHVGNGSRMATGILDVESFSVKVDHLFPSPYDRFLEKNWVMFQRPGGPLQFVYEWHPLKIGTFDKSSGTSSIRVDKEMETPNSFRHIRGSSNGVYHRDELWFLVHGTTWHKGPGPIYYHRIVVLDPSTLRVKRATYPFKLESAEAPVEFSLGMTIDNQDRITIAYSVWDGSSVLRRIDMWKVEALMIGY